MAALALLVLGRVPSFVEPPGMDQGLFLLAGRELARGQALYQDVFLLKPPLIYLAYLPLWWISGPSGLGPALADLALRVLHLLLAASLAARLAGGGEAGERARGATALAYALLVTAPIWGGKIAYLQPEVLSNTVALGALAAALFLRARRPRDLLLGAAAGLLVSLKFLPGVLVLAPLALTLPREEPGRALVGRLPALAGGLLLGLLPAALYLTGTGTWGSFLEVTVAYNANYAGLRVNRLSVAVVEKLWVLLPCLVLGAWWSARSRDPDEAARPPRVRVALWLHLLLAAGVMLAQGKYFYYHFLVLIPPLALLAGLGAAELVPWVRAQEGDAGRRWRLLAATTVAFLALALASEGYRKHEVFFRYRVWNDLPAEYAEHTYVGFGSTMLATRILAVFIQRASDPDESLMVWCMNPWLYALADRDPMNRYVIHKYLLVDEPPHNRFGDFAARRAAFLEQLREDPPACFVVGEHDRTLFERTDSLTQLRNDPALLEALRSNFQPLRRVRNLYLWVRNDRVDRLQPSGGDG